MAGTLTVTTSRASGITSYVLAWLSDGSGDVSGTDFNVKAGELVQVHYTPDGGATQPDAAYDVTLLDENGADVLAGTGANLSQTAATVVVPVISTYFRRTLVAGPLSLVVAAAGAANGGTVQLDVR